MIEKKLDKYFANKLTGYVKQYIMAIYSYDVRRIKTKYGYSIEVKPRKLVDRFYRPVFDISYDDAAIRICNVDAVIKRVKDCISDWRRIDWGNTD